MEQFPTHENTLETVWSDIERLVGVRLQIAELNRSKHSISFQILNPDRGGQPLNKETHEHYRQLFIAESDYLTENNITLDLIPSPTNPGDETDEIVRLVIDLDKVADSK